MSKYENLDKYLAKKDLKVKGKVKVKKSDLTDEKRKELIDQMLRDFGYIE